jgi:uncharacterized protein YjiK
MRNLIQTRCPVFPLALLVCTVTLSTGCHQQSYNSPEGYNLGKPQKMELGKVLNEISGITYNTDDNSLLAIADSKEKVFEINLRKMKLRDYTDKVVAPDSDIEDVVKLDSEIYMLGSKGVIYEVPLHKKDSSGVRSYHFWSTEKNDFETLYYDPSVKGLILLCKTCAHEKSEGVREAYRFDLATKQFDTASFYTINEKEISALVKDDKLKFRPSAAAIHPVNKRLYILVSADNLLVITDTKGHVIEAYNLNPDDFPQAEGIAFAPNGDMFISNEGKFGKATLQFFRYQTGKKK